ncbi:hypothetical protein ACFXHA_35240 [Nocardia sp. NPDC059240]|uniref:hypothetical protein n=1 Tax=Nocardia sp. NPDC059240 TaxID=3346786 RepID=UPI00369D1F4A
MASLHHDTRPDGTGPLLDPRPVISHGLVGGARRPGRSIAIPGIPAPCTCSSVLATQAQVGGPVRMLGEAALQAPAL